MKRFMEQIIKVSMLYVVGYFLIYPICLINYFVCKGLWIYQFICITLSISGVLSWYIINHRHANLQKFSLKYIKPEAYKDFIIQIATIIGLYVLVAIIEIFDLHHPGMRYYYFLRLFIEDEIAFHLSSWARPYPNSMHFLFISFYWLFYIGAKLLFDSKIRFKNLHEIELL